MSESRRLSSHWISTSPRSGSSGTVRNASPDTPATLAAPAAWAQEWPAKPIRIVVPYPPGGPTDVQARVVAQKLSENVGQPVVVENRAGANGNIAGDFVAKQPADGHTLLMSSGGTVSINPHLYSKMSFDPTKDLVPVAAAGSISTLQPNAQTAIIRGASHVPFLSAPPLAAEALSRIMLMQGMVGQLPNVASVFGFVALLLAVCTGPIPGPSEQGRVPAGFRFRGAPAPGIEVRSEGRLLRILVATSGDTGGAVAAAFHRRPGIEVVVLSSGFLLGGTVGVGTLLYAVGIGPLPTGFGIEVELKINVPGMAKEEVNQRWQDWMAPFFENLGGGHADPVVTLTAEHLGRLASDIAQSGEHDEPEGYCIVRYRADPASALTALPQA